MAIEHSLRPVRRRLSNRMVIGAALVSANLWLFPLESHACDCSAPVEQALPSQVDTPLPADTRFWLPALRVTTVPAEDSEEQFELRGPAGLSVPFTATAVVGEQQRLEYIMLTPNEPLAAGEYELLPRASFSTQPEFGPEPIAIVAISADALSRAPLPPRVTERVELLDEETIGTSSCGETRAVVIELDHDGAFTLVALNHAANIGAGVSPWEVSRITTERSITIGEAPCSNSLWSFDDGAAVVQFAAMDLSGNVSEWTTPERLYVETGCACGVLGAPTTPQSLAWLAPAFVLLFAFRRRT